MRRLADCCCFSPPSFLLAFFPSFPPEVAAFSPQGSLWTRPDVPGSTLPHSLPHGIFMGNQAPQHSTVPRRPEPPYLLISSPCRLAFWCTTVERRGSSPCLCSLWVTHHISLSFSRKNTKNKSICMLVLMVRSLSHSFLHFFIILHSPSTTHFY